MSRVGKKIITIPQGVEVKAENNQIIVKGPNGELSIAVKPFVSIDIKDGVLQVSVDNEKDKTQKAIWGTTRALIANNITGVTEKFKKEVELNGVGFRMELKDKLILHIGYSHPVEVEIPSNITLALNKNVLSGESIDKQSIGDFFTMIHDMKPCDVYKQKGFKFPGRFYPKKVGKKAK
jgi:large subunit ribosomal protein L6